VYTVPAISTQIPAGYYGFSCIRVENVVTDWILHPSRPTHLYSRPKSSTQPTPITHWPWWAWKWRVDTCLWHRLTSLAFVEVMGAFNFTVLLTLTHSIIEGNVSSACHWTSTRYNYAMKRTWLLASHNQHCCHLEFALITEKYAPWQHVVINSMIYKGRKYRKIRGSSPKGGNVVREV